MAMERKYHYCILAIEDQDTETIMGYNEARRRYKSVNGSATLYGVYHDDYTVILSK